MSFNIAKASKMKGKQRGYSRVTIIFRSWFLELQMTRNIIHRYCKSYPIKNACDYPAIKAREMDSINFMFN